jgi:dTDP-4-amino-4,6-dideoxygalactose transaminase
VIPVADPGAGVRARRPRIDEAIARVLDSGCYVLGPEVRDFERAFGQWLGLPHAVGVSSGTAALALALRAFDVGPGDEVVTVSHTAVATVAAIALAGATPVLVDVCPSRWVMTAEAVEAAWTPRTRAVVAVHLYGHPIDLEPIAALCRARGAVLIEDCAQAHGAARAARRAGTTGDAACFSFYPTKNLGALGDGGLVATADADRAERLRRLREYGWDAERRCVERGDNARLDPLQAAILGVGLQDLDADLAARRRIADRYDAAFAALPLDVQGGAGPDVVHGRHLYVVRTRRREALRAFLAERGVGTAVHYPVPVHRQPGYAAVARFGALPATDALVDEIVTLPLYPELGEDAQARVVEAVTAFCRGGA